MGRTLDRPLSALRVAAIGGGTGLPIVLEGLRRALFTADSSQGDDGRERLTAIVTVADDGGSSGRLRRAYGVLAPGDVRNCLVALSESQELMKTLFSFRFDGGEDVGGHSLGNLILTALSLVQGDFGTAVDHAAELLGVRGRVIPATLVNVSLRAEMEGGGVVVGESAIARSERRIRRLGLEPPDAPLTPRAAEALRRADLVVIGPGSLYTSLVPPLLVPGVAEAVAESGARVVLVMNGMTERGETHGLTAAEHVRALRRHAPGLPLHDVLVDPAPLSGDVLTRYAAEGASPVRCDAGAVEALGCRLVRRTLLAEGPKVRHDPRALAAALLERLAVNAGRSAGERLARLERERLAFYEAPPPLDGSPF